MAGRKPGLPAPFSNTSSSSSRRSASGCWNRPLKIAQRTRGLRMPRSWSRSRSGAAAVAIRAAVSAGWRRIRTWEIPAADTSTSFSNRSGLGGRGLGRDEAAHRVPDHGAVAHPQRLAEVVQQAPVALDRDLPFGHRRVAEPGQVERQHPMLAGEVGDVLEPVLPRAREAVDEDDRDPGAGAELRVVDPGAFHLDLANVGSPVDLEPLGVRVAVGIRALRRGRVRELADGRREGEVLLQELPDQGGARRVAGGRAHAYPARSRMGISWIWGGWRWSQRMPRGRS